MFFFVEDLDDGEAVVVGAQEDALIGNATIQGETHGLVIGAAIRAGRNLPDKEFRYLRTVIVTAAVYLGFISELAPLHLTFKHRAGVRPYTSFYNFAEPYVFNKQSPPPGLCP